MGNPILFQILLEWKPEEQNDSLKCTYFLTRLGKKAEEEKYKTGLFYYAMIEKGYLEEI